MYNVLEREENIEIVPFQVVDMAGLERMLLMVAVLARGMMADLANKVQDITYQNTDTALLPCDIREEQQTLMNH